MSAYSLTPASEQAVADAMRTSMTITLELQASNTVAWATLCTEHAGDQLEAVITYSASTNSLTLAAGDDDQTQQLADYIEAIVNGNAPFGTWKKQGGTWHDLEGHHAFATAETAATSPRAPAEHDMVNHPPHYTGHPSGVECIDVAEHLPFCLGNAFKYLFRRNEKGSLRQNLEKALWYIRREQAARVEGGPLYMISEAAVFPLGQIVAHEPAPYRHIMEMVGSGRMLDLAESLLVGQIAGMPS